MNKYRYFARIYNDSLFDINQLMKKTYMLLSATILFSSFAALVGMKYQMAHTISSSILFVIALFVLLFMIEKFKHTSLGIFLVFIFTGLLGYNTGPIITHILHINNGNQLLFFALLITGITFSALSLYAIITKKNFQFLTGFLLIGAVIILSLIIINVFFNFHILELILSGLIILFASAMILYTTNNIINGTETSYVSATVTLYLQIYNIFISLLNIISILNNKD